MTPPVLSTPRLSLRAHEAADLPALARLWGDPRVVRHIGGQPFGEAEVWTRLLRSAGLWPVVGYGYWVVIERDGGGFVGELGFADFRRELEPGFGEAPEAGWVVSPAMQGRGYAREALAAAHVWADRVLRRRTVCMISPEHVRSIRLAEALGYRPYAETVYRGSAATLFERRPAA